MTAEVWMREAGRRRRAANTARANAVAFVQDQYPLLWQQFLDDALKAEEPLTHRYPDTEAVA